MCVPLPLRLRHHLSLRPAGQGAAGGLASAGRRGPGPGRTADPRAGAVLSLPFRCPFAALSAVLSLSFLLPFLLPFRCPCTVFSLPFRCPFTAFRRSFAVLSPPLTAALLTQGFEAFLVGMSALRKNTSINSIARFRKGLLAHDGPGGEADRMLAMFMQV